MVFDWGFTKVYAGSNLFPQAFTVDWIVLFSNVVPTSALIRIQSRGFAGPGKIQLVSTARRGGGSPFWGRARPYPPIPYGKKKWKMKTLSPYPPL